MGRYTFVSEGAEAGNAIQKLLLVREQQARQEMLDRQEQAEREAQGKRAQEALDLQRANQEELRRQAADTEAYRRVYNTISGKRTPGIVKIGPEYDERKEAERFGLGGSYEDVPEQGAQIGEDESGVPLYEVHNAPGVVRFKGGWQHLADEEAQRERAVQAEAAAAARAEQARLDRESRKEIADDNNITRQLIAASAAQGRNANADLQRQLLEARIDSLQRDADADTAKANEGITADNAKRQAIADRSQEMMNLIGEVVERDPNDPNNLLGLTGAAANLYGLRVPQLPGVLGGGYVGETANANATINRLSGQSIADFLGTLKAQSRTGATGFGALSAPELKIVQDSANKLKDRNITNVAAFEELKRIYGVMRTAKDRAMKGMEQVMPRRNIRSAQPPAAAGGGGDVEYDMNGNPIR